MGPDTYDLVSLLRDSYVDLPEAAVDDLIDYFVALTTRYARRRPASREFRRRFDLMALQRNLKALGTFGYQTTTRGNPVYMQYVPRTLSLRAAHPRPPTRASAVSPSCSAASSTSCGNCSESGCGDRRSLRDLDVPLPPARGSTASTWSTSPRTASPPSSSSPCARTSTTAIRDAVAQLAEWLDDTRLELAAVHAPTALRADAAGLHEVLLDRLGRRRPPGARRRRDPPDPGPGRGRCPIASWCVHLGVPDGHAAADDNDTAAARRSLEQLVPMAEARGVQLALEVHDQPRCPRPTPWWR